MTNKMTKEKKTSACCNASVTVGGDTTKYYACENCGKACDLSFNHRPAEEE